jgi:hypothetical protein
MSVFTISADAGIVKAIIRATSIVTTTNFFKVLIQESPLLDIDKVEETIINILVFIKTKLSHFRLYYHIKRIKKNG